MDIQIGARGVVASLIDQQFTGTSGDDSIVGTDFRDVISGLAGDDTLRGLGGDDTMAGGDGNDLLDGGTVAHGQDLLDGGGGDDTLLGRRGDDTLHGGAGADVFDGGKDEDVVVLERAGDTPVHGAVVDLGLAGPQDTGDGLDIFIGIEGLVGTSFDDRLSGDAANNTLIGGPGDDTLSGGGGDDLLQADYDTLDGGPGRDFLRVSLHDNQAHANHDPVSVAGGAGIDVLAIEDAGSGHGVRLRLALTGPQNAHLATITISGIEVVSAAGFGEDLMVGDARDNTFYGGMLNDTLKGGDGADILFGDVDLAAPGVARSSFGVDVLIGGAGDDTLIGGAQADHMDGGAGRDRFLYQRIDDSTGRGIGDTFATDVIDHLRADDLIDLGALDADGFFDNGNQAFHIVDAFTNAPGELKIVYDAASDLTWFLTDLRYGAGDARSFFQIAASGDHTGFTGFVL
jgi:Ca2+-binding RTX toxin-like protein